jgi:hypothetical protein
LYSTEKVGVILAGKNKKLYSFFIALIIIFIAIILVWSILENIVLSNQHIILILLISLMGLSFSFDKLMLGRIFSIEKKIENVVTQQDELTEENIKFRERMVDLTLNSINQLNSFTSKNNQSVILNTANVLPASQNENEESDISDESTVDKSISKGNENLEHEDVRSHSAERERAVLKSGRNYIARRFNSPTDSINELRRIAELNAITKIANKLGLPDHDISYDVKISFSDPLVKGRKRVYDAFLDNGSSHYFFEVIFGGFSFQKKDRVYSLLSDVKMYSEVNKIPAKLILILVNHPKAEFNRFDNLDKEKEKYLTELRPAIENNFILIEGLEFNYSEVTKSENEASASEEE